MMALAPAVAWTTPLAESESEVSDMASSLLSQAKAMKDSPRAIVPLLRLMSFEPFLDTGLLYDAYVALAKEVTEPQVRRFLQWQCARLGSDLGRDVTDLPGAVTSFRISPTYDNSSLWGFSQPFPPETGFDTAAISESDGIAARWVPYRSIGNESTILPQEAVYNDGFAVMYLTTRIVVDKAMQARISIPSATPVVAWINGLRVAEQNRMSANPAPMLGTSWAVDLKAGDNILVIKVAALETQPNFFVFLTDAKTDAPLAFHVDIDRAIASEALQESVDLPQGKPSILETLFQSPDMSAPMRALLAMHILPPNEAQNALRDLLLRDLQKTASLPIDDILTAAAVMDDHWTRLELLRIAQQYHPTNPWIRQLYVQAMVDFSTQQSTGVRLVDTWPRAKALLADTKQSLTKGLVTSFVEKAMQQRLVSRQVLEAMPANSSSAFLTAWLTTTSRPEDADERMRVIKKLWEIQQSSPYYLIEILDSDLRQARLSGDESHLARTLAGIQQQVSNFLARHPYDDAMWEYWLNVAEAHGLEALMRTGRNLGLYDEQGWRVSADEQYAVFLDMRANDPNRWRRYAGYLLRAGQNMGSLEAFRMASALAPQDESLRKRANYAPLPDDNESAFEENTFEKPFIIDTIPGNRDASASGYVALLDQRVVQILPNGLTSTFSQVVFEILDEQGVRALRAVPLNYSPTDERLEIISVTTTRKDGTVRQVYDISEYDVADESIRMYFDQRQLVIRLPELAIGDRVEFRFKRTQTHRAASQMPFFSDVFQLQSTFNKQWIRYIVIAPNDFPISFYRHTPLVTSSVLTEVKREEKGNRVIFTFEEHDMPRALAEEMSPGITEIVPFLFVSSFQTWQDVANWYIDLAKPQWVADDAIRAAVRQLVDGAQNRREIVERIYHFVLKTTRYVALEFGIHGYKPYPVPQIFQRKFGDCKDKASLLKVMLEEAGIEANFVIVRTRQNGNIDTLLPSAYVFDHAIVYVPEFDLFLDGTAEFSGMRELPMLDQDALVLIIRDDASYTLRKTPITTASDNVITTHFTFDLRDTQNVQNIRYTGNAAYKGFAAPSYRERYQSQTGQTGGNSEIQIERLKSELAYTIPGTTVLSADFGDIDNLEKDVLIRFEATTTLGDIVKADASGWKILPLVKSVSMSQRFASGAVRKYPLQFPLPITFDETASVILPPNATPTLPAPVSVVGQYGSLNINFHFEDATLTSHARVVLAMHRIEPQVYAGYLDFLQQIDRHLNTPIAIVLDADTPSTSPSSQEK